MKVNEINIPPRENVAYSKETQTVNPEPVERDGKCLLSVVLCGLCYFFLNVLLDPGASFKPGCGEIKKKSSRRLSPLWSCGQKSSVPYCWPHLLSYMVRIKEKRSDIIKIRDNIIEK